MAALLSSFFVLAQLLLVLAMTMQRGLSLEDGPGKFITWDDLTIGNSTSQVVNQVQVGTRIIVVSQDGSGNSKTVQGAIDIVPHGNSERIKILF